MIRSGGSEARFAGLMWDVGGGGGRASCSM